MYFAFARCNTGSCPGRMLYPFPEYSQGDLCRNYVTTMAREFSETFYHSKKWKDMRQYILIRDQYRCQRCGSALNLEVHHIIHLTPGNIHDASITLNDKNLITLCRDCHFAVHEEDKLNGTKKYNAAHAKLDCDQDFVFDANGFLVPKEKTD